MSLTHDELALLAAVAATRSLTDAGRRLHYNRRTVGRKLAAAGRRVGGPLTENRGKNGTHPTRLGWALLDGYGERRE